MTTSDQKMTGAEFRDCLDRYGEDVSTWPCAEAAQDLLMESEEARSRLDEMKRLRSLFNLASRSGIKAPGGLAARIAAAALSDTSRSQAQTEVVAPAGGVAGDTSAASARSNRTATVRRRVRFG